MVLVKPSMVLEAAMDVANLFMVILHVHPLYFAHEPPSIHDNHKDHLLHFVTSTSIVLYLPLLVMVIYFVFASSTTIIPSCVIPTLNCFHYWFKRNMACNHSWDCNYRLSSIPSHIFLRSNILP